MPSAQIQTCIAYEKNFGDSNPPSNENDINIYDATEIIANLLIKLGSVYLDNDRITYKNIYDQIIKDVNKNGDTLPNSIARQGLIMLAWLKSKDET